MLTYSFFCNCSSTESTYMYHRQSGKCAQFLIFCLWAKILSSFQIKPFKCSIFEKIHITESYLIKVLVNIWNLEPRKENLQDFAWSKPLKKCWTGVTFGHLSSFSWPKTIIYGTP